MIDPPQTVQTDRVITAVIRLTVPRKDIQTVMGPAIGEVIAAASAQGAGPAGPVFSHHFKMDPEVFDFEVGVPVMTPVTEIGQYRSLSDKHSLRKGFLQGCSASMFRPFLGELGHLALHHAGVDAVATRLELLLSHLRQEQLIPPVQTLRSGVVALRQAGLKDLKATRE